VTKEQVLAGIVKAKVVAVIRLKDAAGSPRSPRRSAGAGSRRSRSRMTVPAPSRSSARWPGRRRPDARRGREPCSSAGTATDVIAAGPTSSSRRSPTRRPSGPAGRRAFSSLRGPSRLRRSSRPGTPGEPRQGLPRRPRSGRSSSATCAGRCRTSASCRRAASPWRTPGSSRGGRRGRGHRDGPRGREVRRVTAIGRPSSQGARQLIASLAPGGQ